MLFEIGDLGAGVGVRGRHQHVGADGLDQPPPLVVQVLQGDQAHAALVRHHAQPFHLGYRGPVRSLAVPDLLVAVQAHDEEVTEAAGRLQVHRVALVQEDRKSTRLNSSHVRISYAVFCLKKKKNQKQTSSQINKPNKTKKKQ